MNVAWNAYLSVVVGRVIGDFTWQVNSVRSQFEFPMLDLLVVLGGLG